MKKNILFLVPYLISPIVCTSCIWKKENHSKDENLDKFIEKFPTELVLSKSDFWEYSKTQAINKMYELTNDFLNYKHKNHYLFQGFEYYSGFGPEWEITKNLSEKYISERKFTDRKIEIIDLNEYQNSKEKLIKYLEENILKTQYNKYSKEKYDELIKKIIGKIDLNNLKKTKIEYIGGSRIIRNILVLFRFDRITGYYDHYYRLKYVDLRDK